MIDAYQAIQFLNWIAGPFGAMIAAVGDINMS